ncbi:hypothetical protein SRABI96_00651 [Peribacillus sp. Bi96]|nr:hypothetical protein SRABI96_00651 [Peribacillus sp. Bi96]
MFSLIIVKTGTYMNCKSILLPFALWLLFSGRQQKEACYYRMHQQHIDMD